MREIMLKTGLVLGSIALLLLAACGGDSTPTPAADPDAVTLVAMGEEALGLAREAVPDAVLRQVDVSPDGGAISFRYTDEAATQTVAVHVPGPEVPRDDWSVLDEGLSPLIGQASPGIDLRALRAGPAAVARSATGHWSGCGVRALTLYGEGEDLSWTVFCNLPEGVVSGSVDARTGEFTPSSAPPAVPPPSVEADAPTPTPESQSRVTLTFAASCVWLFSPETLRDRAFAFDGTVESVETRVDPRLPTEESQSQELPWVTFKVNRWFKGGESPEVEIWVDPHSPGGVSAVEPGDRLLVAGEYRWGQPPEDPLAWGCGFTQPHTPEAAAAWADAMAE
jgi:hypothetical protein